jgi:hypothetical protein
MIVLDPPWQLATPIGDADGLVWIPGGRDEPSRFLCAIHTTGEFWEFTQLDVRRNTCITDGRTTLTPFSAEAMERFRPMREVAERLAGS